jgi:hypothetical protein
MADYTFIVECINERDYDKATKIAQKELEYYGCPEDALEDFGQEKYDYYYNVGYVEVVKNALEKAGIEANYYAKMYD